MRKLFGLLLVLCAIFPAYGENFYPPRLQNNYMHPATYSPVQTANTGSHYQPATKTRPQNGIRLSREEMKLYNLINQYRQQKGLPAIPLSKSLTTVAQSHARDLAMNYEGLKKANGRACNLHSWSANGPWSPVCYTDDHKNAQGMWNKPKEITGYRGQGYEIAMGGWSSAPGGYRATATEALRGWQKSPGHNQIIVNQSIWRDSDWKSMGIGIYQGYAVAWFGETPDVTAPVIAAEY